MKEILLIDLPKQLAIDVIRLCESICETRIVNKEQYEFIHKECRRIRAILISAIKTAKSSDT